MFHSFSHEHDGKKFPKCKLWGPNFTQTIAVSMISLKSIFSKIIIDLISLNQFDEGLFLMIDTVKLLIKGQHWGKFTFFFKQITCL